MSRQSQPLYVYRAFKNLQRCAIQGFEFCTQSIFSNIDLIPIVSKSLAKRQQTSSHTPLVNNCAGNLAEAESNPISELC